MSLTVIGATSCLAGLVIGWCLTKHLVRWATADDGTALAQHPKVLHLSPEAKAKIIALIEKPPAPNAYLIKMMSDGQK